jgi:DNA invertase Pin-like site-specific DNA recombinase
VIVAYIRVSYSSQNPARQEKALSHSPYQIDKSYVDIASGKDINRPQLKEMLDIVTSGDIVVVHSIDQLCRNMINMCSVTLDLRNRGFSLIFLVENLIFSADQNNSLQELQLHMMSAFSQFERALIKERQADGIAAKKARGERTGRPPADINKVSAVKKLTAKGIKLRLACANVGLGVSTYYKLLKQRSMDKL